jgi:uncharacterized membrane protein required for colicin V production
LLFAAVEIGGQRIIALAQFVHLNLLDRLAGAVFGAMLGAIFAGLNIILLTMLLPPNYPLLQNSELAPKILSTDQSLLGFVPSQMRQVYQDKRDQLARFWNARRDSPATAADSTR